MDEPPIPTDRPECRGVRTVILDVCFAEFDERHVDDRVEAADIGLVS